MYLICCEAAQTDLNLVQFHIKLLIIVIVTTVELRLDME